MKPPNGKRMQKKGIDIFKKLGGSVGKLDGVKYKDEDINVDGCEYENFEKLDDEEKEKLDSWLTSHPEVLKKLDKKIQVNFNIPFNEICQEYIDSLVDYISACVVSEKENKKIRESIFSFEKYILNEDKDKIKYTEKTKYLLDFSNISDSQADDLRDLYINNKEIAILTLQLIGSNLLKNKTFVKNSDNIVNSIISGLENDKRRKIKIPHLTYNILIDSINILKNKRSHEYVNYEEQSKKSED